MVPNIIRRALSVVLAVSIMLLGAPVTAPITALAVPVDGGAVTSDLRCVTFVDPSTGFAAGASGVILKTVNAGASWRTVRSGGPYDFQGISFDDTTNGWVVSLAGQVFKTTDEGESWTLVSDDAGGDGYVVERFYDLDFWGSTAGFAAGGAQGTPPLVAITGNAGSFWSIPLDYLLGSYDPPETQPPFPRDGLGYFYGLDVRSSTKAWVAGQDVFKPLTPLSVIWHWDGADWTQQTVSGTGRLLDIAFGTDTAGVAVGDAGMVRYTLNGGTSWSAGTTGMTSELSGVDLASAQTGWAVGQSGRILRTDNGGVTWASQTSGSSAYLEDVAVMSTTAAVAVGRGGTILRTTDGMTWSGAPAPPPAFAVPIEGADRYATAIEACNKAFGTGIMPLGPDGHRTVVIASGQNWPDALAAAGLAGAYEAPLLLARKDALPANVAARIKSLDADRILIVGGTAAVSDAVKAAIDAVVPGARRISGATRYETSALVAAETINAPGRSAWDGTAFVATGANFPDALAAGPLAAAKGLPLYLATPAPGTISAATLTAMTTANVGRVHVLGGTAVVSDASVAALKARGITPVDRWAGANRYATAAIVAENSLLMGLNAAYPAIATGTNYPDALAGGVMQAASGSVIILTNGTTLSLEAADFLSAKRADVREVRFLGGTRALSSGVRAAAMAAVSAP